MKKTGMTRPVDKMGRIVIPKEIRESLGVRNNLDSFEIMVEEDKIILKKYEPACIFCDCVKEGIEYNGKIVCKDCLDKMMHINAQEQLEEAVDSTLDEIIKTIE